MKTKFILALLVLFLCDLKAQELKLENCDTLAVQQAINECVGRNYLKVEKELDSVFHIVQNKLNHSEKNVLIKSQKSWIKYRDDSVELIGKFSEGGTAQDSQMVLYEIKLMLDRIKEINFYLKYSHGAAIELN
jgi:uncharacterized protein YecT (DUF1311 family)